MTDHERGAYTPPTGDPPLSFDPRQPVRGARPIPVTLILSVLVLGALVAAIFVFYRSGVRQAAESPPTVGAPVAAIRSAATPEAQPQDLAAGLQIYRAEAGGAMGAAVPEPTFVQPPEQPQARPTPKVVVAQAPPAAVALKPAISAPQVPAAKPVAAPVKAAPVVTKPPVQIVKAPAPQLKKAAAPEPKAVVAGAAVVQIGAVSSTALADRAWNEAVSTAPGLAAGKGKSVEKIEKNGGTLYRTAVTGFSSRADAQKFCAALQSAGKSCFVR